MRIAFRVDASIEIGTGHVMRCITLAQQLTSLGHECIFLCRLHPGNLNEYILSLGFYVHWLEVSGEAHNHEYEAMAHSHWLGSSWQEDASQVLASLQSENIDCLVVDHYALDIRWERELSQVTSNIFVIDDLADRNHFCVALLDQNYGRLEEDYYGLVPSEARIYCGPMYALLRPEFSLLREESIRRRDGFALNNILVNLGGVDKDNHTASILAGLSELSLSKEVKIVVVLGLTNPNVKEVSELAKTASLNIEVKVAVNNMAQLMAECDLAIGAAGSTTWERFSLGVPSLLLSIASNQESALASLAKDGYIGSLKLEKLPTGLDDFFNNGFMQKKLNDLSNRCRALCDGSGAIKIAKVMEALV